MPPKPADVLAFLRPMQKFDNADGRVRGARGVAIRAAYLAKHPLCVRCKELGLTQVAQEVDHIVRLADGGPDTEHNKQALCKMHHAEKTLSEGSSAGANPYPEWLKPALGELTIVFGAPGSGKSTYVAQQAKANNIVIDLDLIRSELSGKPIYQSGIEWLGPAIRRRNSMLGRLSNAQCNPAWFVTTGMGKQDRQWWIKKLNPSAVCIIKPTLDVCIKRIRDDARRPDSVKVRHIKAAREWFTAEGRGWRLVAPSGCDAEGNPLNTRHHAYM